MVRTPSAEALRLDAAWAALMTAAQAGDRRSYEELLRGCTPLVRRVARHQGVQADRIDDVVQEVLLTVHKARQTYDPTRSFAAWLTIIAQRRAIDALRRHGRQNRREIHAPDDYENHPDDSERTAGRESANIEEAVKQLPEAQREAIEALALRQLSLDEAAVITGKTKGALKVNMHRALKSLRVRFGGSE